jgi:hypothetical protein
MSSKCLLFRWSELASLQSAPDDRDDPDLAAELREQESAIRILEQFDSE